MAVRALEVEDVAVFRAMRLRSLRADPDAFGSSYEREAAYDDTQWTDFLSSDETGQVFIAEQERGPVGIGGIRGQGDASAVLWGMWVAPEARGAGVGKALVEAAVAWARSIGAEDVILQVAAGNDAAHRLYERCGFESIGQSPLRPDDPCSMATMMRKSVVDSR